MKGLAVPIWATILLAMWIESAPASPPAQRAPGETQTSTNVVVGEWKPLFEGVALAELAVSQPLPKRGQALRIDLETPGLSFFATPANGDRPGETDSLKTSNFLKKHHLQAAINANPFSVVKSAEGVPEEVVGLLVSKGVVTSPTEAGYPTLTISKENRAAIGSASVEGAYNAIAGFGVVLREGKTVGEGKDLHPRAAVGVSRDGRQMYWLVIDGRQPGHSVGATTAEVGDWLRTLGAWDGLNLDGGGTTTLAIADGDRARVVNRPIHNFLPGLERPSGAHLGVYAAPISPAK